MTCSQRSRRMVVALTAVLSVSTAVCADEPQLVELHVGIKEGDFRGSDHRMLQAAVDYVASLGGGTVMIGPGRFEMRDSLKVHSNVTVRGVPGKTVLASCDAHQTQLSHSGGTNEREVTVDDPSGFRIGDGIMIQDDKSMYGFHVTQATIIARLDKNSFRISQPLARDYSRERNARVTSGFPVIGLREANNVELTGLTIDGNADSMEYLTGCRGGGIYLFECENVRIANCTVRNYDGDAISFQTTTHVTIEDCLCESNTGVGLHPGCGTEQATVRRTRCTDNGGDGLFLCWRVKHCLFEGNDFSSNRRHGISIGMKDSDNRFSNNIIASNSITGIYFRKQPERNGAHRNVFETNRILDNGTCIRIEGDHHELVFRANRIGFTARPDKPQTAIIAGAGAKQLTTTDNEFINTEE